MRISDWSSDVCSSDLLVLARTALVDPRQALAPPLQADLPDHRLAHHLRRLRHLVVEGVEREEILALGLRREEARQIAVGVVPLDQRAAGRDRKSTRLNSSH